MTSSSRSTWHILGSGSIACLWGAYLLASAHPVRMIRRDPPPREEYHALRLETAATATQQNLTLEAAAADAPITRLLVCTKAHDAVAALRPLVPRLATNARVVLLQNGIGFQDEAARLVPGGAVYCALSTEGAYLDAPFSVRHAGVGHTLLGGYPRDDLTAAEALAAELRATGLVVRALADTTTALWRKFAINCAINPLSAVRGVCNGALLDEPDIHTEFRLLCREIASILAAIGHTEIADTVETDASEVARATAGNRCSMLQDLEARRRTEIDYLTGYLCRRAHEAGVPSIFNDALYTRIRALERN